jgi:hypothetical protein
MSISKIIWQTHEWEYEDLPEIYKKTSQTWQVLNPDWEYRYASAAKRREMVVELGSHFINSGSYDQYDPVIAGMMQADLWRILVVYYYGGVYADMDSVCLAPLQEMLDLYSDKDLIVTPPFAMYDRDEATGKHFVTIDNILNTKQGYKYHINNANFAGKQYSKVLGRAIELLKTGNPSGMNNYQATLAFANPGIVSYDFRWALHNNDFKDDSVFNKHNN